MSDQPAHTSSRSEVRSALSRVRDASHRIGMESERTRPSETALELILKDAQDLVIYAQAVAALAENYVKSQRSRQAIREATE